MASGSVKAELSTCRHSRPQVTCRLLYKSVSLLVFRLILWKRMNGVDSLGSNQECRIGNKHSHSRVFQCLTSIRKLGNHPGWGYRNEPRSQVSMWHAKSTVRHRIDSLNERNAKKASTLHAETLVTANS